MSDYEEIEIDGKVLDVVFIFYKGYAAHGTYDEYHIIEVKDVKGRLVDYDEQSVIEALEEIRTRDF